MASSQSNVSQHLALLHRAGVLGVRRQGPHRYYRVIDPLVVEVCQLVDYAVCGTGSWRLAQALRQVV